MVEEEGILEIGRVKHFFVKLNMAILELTAPLSVDDCILIKGPTTEFEQNVTAIQVNHKSVQRAEGGQSVGLKLVYPTKEQDVVYKKL